MAIPLRYRNIPGNFRRYLPPNSGKLPEINESIYGPHGSYQQKLFDKRWIEKRNEILRRDRNQCRVCGSQKNLEVHHRQYHYLNNENRFKDPWDYEPELLITLCKTCNQKGRTQFEIPIKKI